MVVSEMEEAKALHVPAAYGDSPEGWTWSRLDDICEGVFDCPHSTPKLTASGPFVVRTQDIITAVFRADQAGRVSEETYKDRIARVTPSRAIFYTVVREPILGLRPKCHRTPAFVSDSGWFSFGRTVADSTSVSSAAG